MAINVLAWTEGLTVEPQAEQQIFNVSQLPILAGHVAVMYAQRTLVEPVVALKQVLCVKG